MNDKKILIKPLVFLTLIIGLSFAFLKLNMLGDAYNRIFIILGGNFLEGGYIQYLTYFSFFLSYELIQLKRKFISLQLDFNAKTVLNKKEKVVLLSTDVNDIRMKTEEAPHTAKSIINKIIIRACTKFRTNNSISDMMIMVTEQIESYSDQEYVGNGSIRYLNNSIPSLGFIGTIIGLSGAIKWANSGNMSVITSELAVAFDTTLVALILSLVINWYYNLLENECDTYFLNVKHIITDRLVNRIETGNVNVN